MSGLILKTIIKNTFDGIPIEIDVDGKNVIITGDNGCGKTRLVERIYKHLFSRIASRELPFIDDLKKELQQNISSKHQVMVGSSQWSYFNTNIPRLEASLKELEDFNIEFSRDGFEYLLASYQNNESILLYFPATRMAKIDSVNAIRPLNVIKSQSNNVNQHYDAGDHHNNLTKTRFFEEYLVSLKQTSSMLFTEYKDEEGKRIIDDWFKKLEFDLGNLFEDSKLKLNFLVEDGHFRIHQENKEPYRLQNLSSGFSSILSIYAELMMNVEVKNINPKDLIGIVIIDEIDAHLHISLQKKIFSFLTDSFPKIQFIVTTHSPFVVMSVDDAVIYDLSTKSQVEDLSAYSYASVATGLFKTAPVSDIISEKIVELTSLVDTPDADLKYIKSIIAAISRHENELDETSLLFLREAQIKVARLAQDSEG